MHLLSGPPLQGNPQGLALTREEGSPETAYPLTKSQESIWLEYQKDASSTKYNVTLEWEISDATKGAPCVRQVLQAIYALTERHAILRSTITSIDGAPHLTEWNTGIVDPDIHMVCRNNTISEQSLSRLLRRPFSLEVDPPVRWTVIQCPTALRVFLVGHHIVVDGHALSVLSKEFVVMLNDDGAQLPPPPSFSSMNLIEQQWLGSQSYLDSCKSVIDQVRTKNNSQWPRTTAAHKMTPENSAYRAIYTMHDFTIDELTAWGQQYSTTWFRVVSSVLALLVIDQTRPQFGMDEVLSVGFRGRPEGMHACVGQFANSLPVKFPLWEAQKQTGTFKTLVALVSKNISMVKKSELLSDMEIVPLAKTLNLDYQPPRIAITCPPKLANDNCHLYPLEGSWDVLFYFEHHLAGVKLGVIYDPAFVSSTQLNSMKLLLRNLVTISRRPDALLSEMLEWIPTYASLPAAVQSPQGNPMKHVHHWIQAHADTSPNSMALYSKEMKTSMTYGALDISAESKAKCLIVNGVPARGRVLINVRRGFQVIEWIFAVFKCGSAFAYMDPTLAEKQKAIIVRNFKPSLVVDDAFLRDVYSSFQEGTSEVNTKITSNNTAGDDLAYMIYTSGSTGEPKGVMVEHQNIAAFIQSSISAARCGFGSRILQLAAFTFDASILEWATALCTGGSLCFAQYPERLVGDYLADVIDENKISFLQITPTALETLPVSRKVPTLRYISVGGEAPSRETFAKWHSRVDLINVYGPTEAAVAVTYNLMEKATPLSKFVSAGIPNRGTGIHICDEGFGPILEQGVGEICISGAQVARGYCENPTITARNFAVHSSGIRMYRTGDRGMFLDDGSLVVLGRIDRELKIRGFRIAPEEIENAILEAGIGCHEASVQKSENGLEMIAFVSPATISPSELRTLLRNSLPGYKVPSRFYPLPTLPKSTTGKIDHKKVRMNLSKLTEEHDLGASLFPDDHASERKGYTSRASIQETTEEMVQRIWQQVLGASNSLPKDVNFFDVGGHSLLMPKLHEGLKAAFPTISVRLVDLFQHSTIHSQTLLLQGNSGGRSEVVTPFETAPGSSTHSSLRVSTVASPGIVTGATSPAILTPPLVEIDTNHHSGVAIVGLAGRFPKAANANEFYDKLMDGYSGITDFKKRTEPEAIPEAIWVPRAGVLDNIERFDNDFWKLSKEDATDMDPQHRIFMEVAHEALADAGMEAADLRRECVGLFIGAASDSYHLHTKSVIKDPFLLQTKSSMTPSISARAAYHLNLSGPNATVQTSCASSTVAFAMAYDAIRLGRCNVAIVGGVSIQLYEGGYLTRKGHILSTRGECNPFDSRADGQVPSDAVTAVVLRGYTAATEASTVSYANVMAAASGSDGAIDKAGFQVPSARGQAEVIKAAWRDAKVPSQGLQYAEIHGSGTVVGDALELEGLGLAMKELKLDGTRIAVGTAKGNIGNTQQSSGLVSLIKLCKSMQNGLVPAIKGLDEVHPAIDDTLPIDFARRRMRLHPGNLLAVSALGWGGVNCHIVLGFPREHLLKRSTKVLSESSFNHRILAAPRLKKAPIPVNHTAASQVTFASDNSNDHPAPATKPISLKERHVNEVKIDKAEQIQHSRTQSDENKQQKSDVEMELKKLWASVLVKPDTSISSSDSFLQIGGDSISALRLVSVARRHNIGLTVAMVFQHPQLSEMAAHAKVVKDEMSGIVRPFSLISNNEVDEVMNEIRDQCGLWPEQTIEDAYPCTTLQEGLMALSVTRPGSYILRNVFRLASHVDVSRFKAAWEMTVKKCANLRTRIVLVGDQHIQAEVTEDVLWRSVRTANPKAFLKSDHKLVMGYGTPLSRYTLLEDEGSNPKRYFVWTAHHAVFDGWTMQNIIKIFTSAYERSRIPSIRPFSAFVDYTMKLKAEESKAYWKEQLSGAQRSIFPFVEDEAKIGQDTKTTTQILQLQQRSQSSITKATIIRAAWAIVLARYNESDDICFGTVVSGRQAPVVDVESVTGPMIATVPVRVRLDKEQTVANFLHDVQAQALNMVPFEQFGLQNIAKVSDDAKKACELSNLIAVQPMEQMSSFDGDCSEVFVQTDDDEYDANEILESYFTYPLVAQAKVFESHISFEVTHKVDVVSEARIVALGHHMEHVTAQLLMCADSSDDKTMLLGDLSVAGSWDLQQATDFNMMEDPDSADACLHDVISQESQKASSREAIYTKDVSFTYGDLDQHSTRLAHELVRAGVQGETVPFCFEKSAWEIVAMLGILKAGAAFMPLDPSYPVRYRSKLMAQVSARTVLASPQTSPLFQSDAFNVIVLSSSSPFLTSTSSIEPQKLPQCTKNSAAYVLFPSKSTGKHRGVVIEHSAASSSFLALQKKLNIGTTTRHLQFSNYTSDTCIGEILGTLACGGTICVPSEDDQLQNLAAFITQARVNTAVLTPTVLETLIPGQTPTLTQILVVGMKLTKDIVDVWADRVSLIRIYGPPEACNVATMHAFSSPEESTSIIGRGANSLAWIADILHPSRLAPIGCVGELVIQGPGLARGYLNDDEGTTHSFTDAVDFLPPQQISRTAKFYRTGDLVQYNSDGELEYVSRKATQRKICGQRFDLGDVEYRVRELGQGQISNLAAEVLQLQEVEFLAVFINLTEDETSTQATSILPNTGPRQVFLKDLEQRISERIPSYMVPSYCIPVSRLPKSAAGEIDRAALRQLAESLAAQDLLPYSASRGSLFRDCSNDLEARLRKIWAQVLGIPTESISVDDDFYQLGGDSIRIITLMKLMKKQLGISISISTLIGRKTTVSRIAAIVQSSSSIASPSEMPQIDVMSKLLAITDEAWAAEANLARIGAVATLSENATVFLTGATGFLGTEILRQLLQKKQIRTVAVLVRATSTLQGLQRIKRTAVIAKWWNDAYEEKLEIWTGDLGAKQLGLDGIYWNRLAGQAGDGNIDAIIHNGAVVNWNDDYEKLQAPNVDSTISLLKLAIASPAKPRLVYISGGIKTDPQDDRAKTSKKLAGTNGYAQTKYVSEAVISEIASRLSASTKQQQNRFSVVKPGLIIGTAKEGVANLDDFLWRITAAAAAMKIYPEESNNSWLYVSDSSTLSQKITRQLIVQEGEAFVDLSLGLPTSQFWGLVNSELDISCKPVPWESWIRSAEEQMQKAGERHVLWPVQHFLGGLGYTVKTCSPAEEGSELPLAIKANVRYLRRLGFIQQQSQEPTQVKGDVLRRSHAGAVA
ncbi:hypothetical protein DCS_06362 [Drechmeria coniospora]|uniref:Non-ribosomal peptide synthetase n=1 Tax=Drechmeria coniospora TaxID=98403 RepID=A0A151GBI0_DRECN|nr:hypothetical protein DCS_06362 [Drechmeria coniospora]KYK54404.1 hypothetical protein DCS_06362 [Drechmeria coniospora]